MPGLIWINLKNANIALPATIRGISLLLLIVSGILGSIAIIVAVKNLKQGQHSSIISVYREAIKLFLPVSVVSIISCLIVMGGLILLIAPGILFYIWYFFSPYAAIIHKKRKTEALALSKAVVRTSMWKVIGYILLTGIVVYGSSYLFFLLIMEKGVFPFFLPRLLASIIFVGIGNILGVWVTAFLFMFYLDLIKANPRISECFELEKMEYEETKSI
jgi:hypothetical protein